MLGTSPPILFVVFAQPPADREAEFHDWYDKVHGPDAIENGSFTALHRYRAVGPGWKQAQFLALWEGRFTSEKEAWDYIAPLAQQLREEGRVGDIASVVWASMMLAVRAHPEGTIPPASPGARSLTTVQNDWRHPDPALSAQQWWDRQGLDSAPATGRYLYTSDPNGRGGGYHLALFEHQGPAADSNSGWTTTAATGTSPTPPYTSIFVDAKAPAVDASQPPAAPAWVMQWEWVASLGG